MKQEQKQKVVRAAADALTRELIEQGKLIEMGWVLFRQFVIPKDAPEVQVSEMRLAFMAGAQHLWGCTMGALDAGEEPTDADMRRMNNINAEMTEIYEELRLRGLKPTGSA